MRESEEGTYYGNRESSFFLLSESLDNEKMDHQSMCSRCCGHKDFVLQNYQVFLENMAKGILITFLSSTVLCREGGMVKTKSSSCHVLSRQWGPSESTRGRSAGSTVAFQQWSVHPVSTNQRCDEIIQVIQMRL